MTGKYILVEGKPVEEPDLLKWAGWFEKNKRIVRQHYFYGFPFRLVSTVFLGLDHNYFSKGPPILWETMIFGGPLNCYQRRYSSLESALRGHKHALRLAWLSPFIWCGQKVRTLFKGDQE